LLLFDVEVRITYKKTNNTQTGHNTQTNRQTNQNKIQQNKQTGVKLNQYLAHKSKVWGCDFSSNGLYFVSCSDDSTVLLWHTASSNKKNKTKQINN
jgi:WD40 repeat protein